LLGIKPFDPESIGALFIERSLWEEGRAAAGPDFYPWGLRESRLELDKMLEYACRQGFTSHKFEPEDLFHPSTLNI